jgi:hypothetical protein
MTKKEIINQVIVQIIQVSITLVVEWGVEVLKNLHSHLF